MQNRADFRTTARRLTLLSLIAAAGLPALAQNRLLDEASGLGLELPAGYTVAKAPPRARQDVLFTIRSEGGQPVAKNRDGSLCALAFAKAASNAALSQDQVNAVSRKPEWRNVAKATLELVFDVQRLDSIALNGIEGIAMQAVPKANFADQDVFMHVSMLETPSGRTTLACVTSKAGAESALPVFESIRAGVQPPR